MKRWHNQQGLTLFELITVLIIASIILASTAATHAKFLKIHKRQQRALQTQNELAKVEESLIKSLISMPGRDFAFFSGHDYQLPTLPQAGKDSQGKDINLGVVTPLKINGEDAFIVLASSRNTSPRMELAKSADLSSGTLAVAYPTRSATNDPAVPNPTNFRAGDLMLVIGVEANTKVATRPQAQLIRLTSTPEVNKPLVRTSTSLPVTLNFSFTDCNSGCNGLTNLQSGKGISTINTFAVGSAVIPIQIYIYHVMNFAGQKALVRTDGGQIVSDSAGFQVVGGNYYKIGEIDSLNITYQLTDGTTRLTPNSPTQVNWLDDINSVTLSVTRQIPSPLNDDTINRAVTYSYPVRALLTD